MRIQEITPDIAKSLGLKNEDGVLISMVNPGEPAEKGGLKAGDVILEFNGKKIKDVKSLQRTVADSAVESKAMRKVWRNKKLKSFTFYLNNIRCLFFSVISLHSLKQAYPVLRSWSTTLATPIFMI